MIGRHHAKKRKGTGGAIRVAKGLLASRAGVGRLHLTDERHGDVQGEKRSGQAWRRGITAGTA